MFDFYTLYFLIHSICACVCACARFYTLTTGGGKPHYKLVLIFLGQGWPFLYPGRVLWAVLPERHRQCSLLCRCEGSVFPSLFLYTIYIRQVEILLFIQNKKNLCHANCKNIVTYNNESPGESWTLMRKKITIRVQNKSTACIKYILKQTSPYPICKVLANPILSNCCFYIELNSLAYKDFMDVIC